MKRIQQNTASRPRLCAWSKTLMIAATVALILALSVTAYATGFFSPRQVVIVEKPAAENQTEAAESPAVSSQVYVPPETERRVSVTQPLAVPEGLDEETYAKAANSVAAYNEYMEWFAAISAEEPKEPGVREKATEQGWGALTPEEMQSWRNYQQEAEAFYTRVNAEKRTVVQNILDKYGLKFRREPGAGNTLWSWETFEATDLAHWGEIQHDYRSDENYMSNAELAAWISENFCHGDYFSEQPAGFDKVYWLPDGDFCVSYMLDLHGEGYAGMTSCYAYCSSYDVFHDGSEVIQLLADGVNVTERSHTAADGTPLTIITAGKQAVIYAFLNDYFFNETVYSKTELSEEELNVIADSVIYSNIGK